MHRYRIYTGPTTSVQVANVFKAAGFDAFAGTEHVIVYTAAQVVELQFVLNAALGTAHGYIIQFAGRY